jgi:isochorismate hydrolase
MVRRSASQKTNLSQDMIAKTINQSNHCFSFPMTPSNKTTEKVKHNNQVIIIPDMANAVICPETGKSLKHQELINKLRYKIKCM